MKKQLSKFSKTLAWIGIATVAGFGSARLTQAGDKLWTERGDAAPIVAQVPNFARLAAETTPSVVTVNVAQKVKMNRGMGGMQSPFEFFFRGQGQGGAPEAQPREYQTQGIGSGVVIREDGLVLTNYHVVENADDIEVTFESSDGTKETKRGKVLGKAPEYDVALVQVQDTHNAPVAPLGDSDQLQIGDWVMAIGTPFGLSHTVSVGIISAKDRRDIAPSGRTGVYDFLQTDASINPGNSGGPLVNTKGEVIGINTAINAQGSGIGFAIPINMVKAMLPQLSKSGSFARSWVGVRIQPLTPELAQSYGLAQSQGALVAEVVPQGPAAKAGLKEGDVIQTFDGKAVRQASDLQLFSSMAGVGRKVVLKVWREGASKNVDLRLEAFPDADGQAAAVDAPDAGGEKALGMVLSDITPGMQQQLGLGATRGAVLTQVEPGSPSARSGLRPGDLLQSINGVAIESAQQAATVIRKTASGSVLRIKIVRQEGQFFTAMRKP